MLLDLRAVFQVVPRCRCILVADKPQKDLNDTRLMTFTKSDAGKVGCTTEPMVRVAPAARRRALLRLGRISGHGETWTGAQCTTFESCATTTARTG